jgi:hypothetical protein
MKIRNIKDFENTILGMNILNLSEKRKDINIAVMTLVLITKKQFLIKILNSMFL